MEVNTTNNGRKVAPALKFIIQFETLFYVFINLLQLYGTQTISNFRITNIRMCLLPDYVVYTINRVSLQQCVEECAALSECSAVNYKRRYKLCELHANLHENFAILLDGLSGSCVFVKRADIHEGSSKLCQKCNTNEGQCEPKQCETNFCPSLEIKNGVLHGNMRTIGARVEIECRPLNANKPSHQIYTTCQVNGSWTNYSTCPGFVYIGCYEDRPERILNGYGFQSQSMTSEMCSMECLRNGFIYALTQYSQQCFCGNILIAYPKRPEDECNMRCGGNPNEICGGPWRGSLYKYV